MVPEKLEANRQIRQAQLQLGFADGAAALPFLCECTDIGCRALVRLTGPAYDGARAHGGRCIVCAGHPHSGRVVDAGDGYAVVEE